MKKLILVVTCLFVFVAFTNAQYSINKTNYNPKSYIYQIGDPYNPSIAGLTSFLIPGLGQMLSGEGGRGAAFLGGYLGSWVVYGVGVGMMSVDIDEDGYYDGAGAGAVLIGIGGAIAVNIWSIIDAVKVSKVNNMAWRDSQAAGMSLNIQPYIGTNTHTNSRPIGLSVRLTF